MYPMTVLNTIDLANPLNTIAYIKGNGDLNGDGIKDLVLVRAIEGVQYYKEVAVYYGGSPFDLNPDIIITTYGPEHINYESDLNGDGFDDLVISNPISGESSEGRILIYFGSNNFDSDPDLEFLGESYCMTPWNDYMHFGLEINTKADYNGDGFDDLLVTSALIYDYYKGQANIFFGGPNMDTESDWSFTGFIAEEFASAASSGDINGDGYDDWALMSRNYTMFEPNSDYIQTLKIYLGGQNPDNTVDYTYSVYSYDCRLLMGSDVNQDSYDDLLMDTVVDGIQMLWGANALPQYFQYILQEGGQKELMDDVEINNKPCIMYYSVCDTTIYLSSYNNQNGFVKDYFFKNTSDSLKIFQLFYIGDINNDTNPEFTGFMRNNNTNINGYAILSIDLTPESADPLPQPEKNCLVAYPNPFESSIKIKSSDESKKFNKLQIYNIKGQLIKEFSSNRALKEFVWDGRDNQNKEVSSGIYIISGINGDYKYLKKVIKLK
jgi:hypothetical protein